LVATTLGCALSGCSSEVGFPAIHDMPSPRADTPLTPDQVKQATDDLTSQRDHLQATAASVQAASAPVTTGSTPAAGGDSKP
jgi:hypothetical protein